MPEQNDSLWAGEQYDPYHEPQTRAYYQAQLAGQNFAEVPKAQATPPIVPGGFHERSGRNSGFDDERVPTVVLHKRTRKQSAVTRGNNRFGSKGTLACQYCRRQKRKVLVSAEGGLTVVYV
jgi:hypothetical protein